MYGSDYEQALFSLDPNLEKLRDLKEKYIRFNRSHADRPDEARSALDALISEYKSSGYTIFEEVAKALSAYKQAVINSFTVIERTDSKGHTIVQWAYGVSKSCSQGYEKARKRLQQL